MLVLTGDTDEHRKMGSDIVQCKLPATEHRTYQRPPRVLTILHVVVTRQILGRAGFRDAMQQGF